MSSSTTERPTFQAVRDRTITTLWLVPVATIAILAPFPVFLASMGALAMRSIWEWILMTRRARTRSRFIWMTAGIAYLFCTFLAVLYLREVEGNLALLWLVFIVIASDTAPFLLATSPWHRLIEHAVIAPSIHPQKSWDGVLLSIIASVLMGMLCVTLLPAEVRLYALAIAATCGAAARAGDFAESWIKRTFDVKHTGSLLPGHGGLLDRIDGILGAIPVFILWMWLLA